MNAPDGQRLWRDAEPRKQLMPQLCSQLACMINCPQFSCRVLSFLDISFAEQYIDVGCRVVV